MHTLLPFFGVIRVSGDDRHEFLHNQLSNDIKNLAKNQACYATYNTPKGRVIANMLVLNTGDELMLALAADVAEKVVKRLKMFVLRAKVQLDILADWGVSGSLQENAPPVYPSEPHLVLNMNDVGEIVLPHAGSLKIAPQNTLPEYHPHAEEVWNIHEISSGYAWIHAATSETCVAQMLNQHTIGGVHFRKGCYPGQEIIARAQYRGQVKRGLAVARSTVAQTAGAEVVDASGAEAGLVLNIAGCLNLLVIKHGAANGELRDTAGNAFTLEHLFFETNTLADE
ncbi:YgfZ/GcvT domain-containing protein [Alysiella crassa]|uniref:tRNA-modifying protein ygfZ n=1 Tax=Alysiella crassa TaxID=153491 RepID=A0A376BU55_9NEIS|nr:folate-binding protein YgfZ [Alysiella crassa]UOP06026.1 folate-binding protein YgfZ [Alysiella crassa]SSY80476.1 tRNA-modifying protein ygfZ [Alysiella crassa]